MKVAVIGVGAMGVHMAGHLKDKGHEVFAHDLDEAKMAAAAERGAKPVKTLKELAALAEMFILMVATDQQSADVTHGLTEVLKAKEPGSTLIAIGATNHPAAMQDLAKHCAGHGVRFVDSPVVYGMHGAATGTLLSLCGGSEADFAFAKPALMAYSRDALHVGPVGAGQLAKACNNLLHWVHAVSNYECLLLAKRYGVDAQRMREVLIQAPARNGTLERWDNTKYTWQEKDMDVVMDLAQQAGLVLPLSGQVDQLVKLFSAKDVAELLHGPEASYLGRSFGPLAPEQGGLGD
ncbi:MAG TPA: NAD(P)-dependent oxidoreductase [Stellaceae bacterium]|jgi:3-hydroxyisobutyrate dehydrogenase-like beta-hydroxyacid dehydrogenase|nr:NAD(P)-dependent oxidoreductase [Stellaceae bacterium]